MAMNTLRELPYQGIWWPFPNKYPDFFRPGGEVHGK